MMVNRWILMSALVLTVTACRGRKQRSVAEPSPKNAPQSTGAEFTAPKTSMSPAAAQAAMGDMITEAARAKPDCAKATGASVQSAFYVLRPDASFYRSNEKSLVAAARCAESEHAYAFMLRLAMGLASASPADDGHPELAARALIGMGATSDAEKLLRQLLVKHPADANLTLTLAKLKCRVDEYKSCLESADKTLKLVGVAKTDEAKATAWRAQKYRARALLHAGKFAETTAAIDQAVKLGAPRSVTDELKKEVVPAQATRSLTSVEMSDQIPLGAYHLFGKVKAVGSLVEVKVYNLDTVDRQMKIETEIQGTTARVSQTTTVLKGGFETVHLSPPLKPDFNVSNVRAQTPASFTIKVSRIDGNKDLVVYEETHPVTLLPRDSLPLVRFFDRDRSFSRKTPQFLAAWATPNAKAIDEFLASAKKRLAKGTSFSGAQSATMPQVKAIYDELRERGMSYVMDPDLFGQGTLVQRTRLPADVIKSTNAQCLEGALLYATLFEAIGLQPVIVWVPGHAFVAWRAEGHDPNAGQLNFLETTATHDADFEQSVRYAEKEYADHKARREFEPSASGGDAPAMLVEIKKLRAEGVTPQPFD